MKIKDFDQRVKAMKEAELIKNIKQQPLPDYVHKLVNDINHLASAIKESQAIGEAEGYDKANEFMKRWFENNKPTCSSQDAK